MWRSRDKPTTPIRRSPSSNFVFSSFKDIESLCSDESSGLPRPAPSQTSSSRPNSKASIFQRVLRANAVVRALSKPLPPLERRPEPNFNSTSSALPKNAESFQSEPTISIPGAEKRIVVYLTSLHVVRSTFEACRTVQSILTGFRVTIDERDLSMDSTFVNELHKILNIPEKTKLTLPRVFIGGRYVGGAEEVMQLNETGELKKLVEGLPAADKGICEVCGGFSFILCNDCNGSHKCYSDKSGFRSCGACNENGLIRCPSCPSSDPL